jgi:hypothetical protein
MYVEDSTTAWCRPRNDLPPRAPRRRPSGASRDGPHRACQQRPWDPPGTRRASSRSSEWQSLPRHARRRHGGATRDAPPPRLPLALMCPVKIFF